MNQSRTPLFSKLTEHQQTSPWSFHVPGHKNGNVFFSKAKPVFEQILSIDQTEIAGLDDLHDANGVIHEAQQLTAELYQTKSTHFLVGGSTVGNLAMLMTVADRGDVVLVQRNSHQSIFHGLELAGLRPVFLKPEKDEETGLALGVPLSTLKLGLHQFPEAKAVFLTNPTYEGYGQLLNQHVRVAHASGMVVCVDEAHGAHFIHEEASWPQSALMAGADLVVQSAHKTLPAMTMASFIHINTHQVNEEKLKTFLRMLQSSSPSYPLMASLDVARAYLASFMEQDWTRLTEDISALKGQLKKGPGWRQANQKIGNYVQDPLKWVFVTEHKQAAYKWKQRLEQRFAFPELASPQHLLLTLPFTKIGIDKEPIIAMLSEILTLNEQEVGQGFREGVELASPVSELALSMSDSHELETKVIPWKQSEGEIAAETITPYPPGIPLIVKGERIREDQLIKLTQLIETEASFQTGRGWIEQGMTIFRDRGE
ncbi:hypothetical protein CR194_19545 [Salipaludibacillus keqinensis]|uniref:Lysine decarboxylase n=1 Tax=Salipaludibacillus keqinensis TaxID=2045207 RepID=A0A323T6D4_9BACI|nr:aminotransferase class I/II-fold pyridoxal phosphate-dependent enzyme [Salipaludibacillus keqinensis]PYZ91529.1 hypothetical protein CR194_19545 [Salipaludibacillus keqinensis]